MFLSRSAETQFHFYARNNFLKKIRAKNQYFLTTGHGSFLCRGRCRGPGIDRNQKIPEPEPEPAHRNRNWNQNLIPEP